MSNERPYQQCSLSVMDAIADPDITFDEKGICNYYYEYQKAAKENVFTGEAGEKNIEQLVNKIKEAGKGKPYDCVMGVSGGVDSTYVAYLAKKHGLRPLAVHFDNGWNSELAVKNIENLVSKLDIDLHTLVINWEEFKDIQLAYLKASVIDIEAVTDHAITGTISTLAKKYDIKYSLTGSNVVTEFVMPPSWIFNKSDHINLQDIHKKFGTIPLKSYPIYNIYLKKYTHNVIKMESVALLNSVPYNKQEIKDFIQKELAWRDYGGKHYESIFTKFYQAYILPVKFKVDKRKPHLSTLIFSGQITKQEALAELERPLYDSNEFRHDYDFILKKLGLTNGEFEDLMRLPVKDHRDYKTETSVYQRFPVLKLIRPLIRTVIK
ncbi:MAG TPA: N-acetyl sugar amidotransferase [Ferruginibacter sp.]|jgi:N-acetyl sugar amidotransferase|nr:N-acetyl sugar amidotransferase [Ferruginibacter sp.]